MTVTMASSAEDAKEEKAKVSGSEDVELAGDVAVVEEKGGIEGADKEVQDESATKAAPAVFSVLWVAYLCLFVDFLGLATSIPILPYFTLELPWDSDTVCPSCPQDGATTDFSVEGRCGEIAGCGTSLDVGMTSTAFAGGQILGNFVMSKLSDRVGRKPIIMVSLACSALGYMWCGLAPNLYHLYFARLFSGIAGGTMPVVQAMVLDVTGDPRERPKYFGICGAFLGLAFMAGPALGAALAALLDKRAALFSPTFIAASVILVGIFKIHETRPAGGLCGPCSAKAAAIHDEGVAQFAAMRASDPGAAAAPDVTGVKLPREVYACALALGLSSFSFTTMTSMCALTWPPSYNLGPVELGVFLMLVGLLAIFNNVVVVKNASARFGQEKVVLFCNLWQWVGISLFTFMDLLDPGNMVIFVPYIIFFVGFICMPWDLQMPMLSNMAGDRAPPELRGMATGIVASGFSAGMALCPIASGPLFMVDFLSFEHEYGRFSHSIFVFGGLMNLVAFVLLWVCVGTGKKA